MFYAGVKIARIEPEAGAKAPAGGSQAIPGKEETRSKPMRYSNPAISGVFLVN
jgi:hypothetical protein